MTDDEFEQGPNVWASYPDPFPQVEPGDPNEMKAAVQ